MSTIITQIEATEARFKHTERQHQQIDFGNGITTSYAYDPQTFRYDPLYRLISASGKECVAQLSYGLTDNFDDLPFLRNLTPGDPMT